METKRSQNKVAMIYGVYMALSSIVVFLLFYIMNVDMESKLPSVATWLLVILFIVLAIKSYRDNDLDGSISYGRSLGTGVLTTLYSGFLLAAFMLIFYGAIDPDMKEKIIENATKKMVEQGRGEQEIELAVSMTRKFLEPGWLFLLTIVGSALMGFLFSLLISIFMRKEQNPFNSNIG